jgi:hypothetical protein
MIKKYSNTYRLLTFSLLAAITLSSSLVRAQENPFKFKEPVPKQPVVPVAPVVIQSDELSGSQRDEVKAMLMRALNEFDKESASVDTVTGKVNFNGKDYIILFDGDRYIGVSSGMHVVKSAAKSDFVYHDSQKYSGVITEAEYVNFQKERGMRRIESAAMALGLNGVSGDDYNVKNKEVADKYSSKPEVIQPRNLEK